MRVAFNGNETHLSVWEDVAGPFANEELAQEYVSSTFLESDPNVPPPTLRVIRDAGSFVAVVQRRTKIQRLGEEAEPVDPAS